MVAAHGVLIEMFRAVSSFASQPDRLAGHLRCANYALLARAACRRETPGRGRLLGGLVEVQWPFSALTTVNHAGLDLELRRYLALTAQPGATLPTPLTWTANAFVPDPQWLEQFARGPAARALIDRLLAGIRAEPTIANILSRYAGEFAQGLERLSREAPEQTFGATVLADDFDIALLRSDNPEIRPSANFALRQAFSTARGLRRLAELAMPHLPIVPTDLQPAFFADPDRSPAHAIPLLVEYADRSHVLGKILDAAAKERPSDTQLARANESMARWNRAFEAAIRADKAGPVLRDPFRSVTTIPQSVGVEENPPGEEDLVIDLWARAGYDPYFLGSRVPVPATSGRVALQAHLSPLHYCRFSILLSKASRTPVCVAANIGEERPFGLDRSLDLQGLARCRADPRVRPTDQDLAPGNRAYMVQPGDLMYGSTEETLRAIADARLAPNQVRMAALGRGEGEPPEAMETVWQRMDAYLLRAGFSDRKRIAMFTGVAGSGDGVFRWKVIAATNKKPAELWSVAFTIGAEPEKPGSSIILQLRVADLEARTGLSFGALPAVDALQGSLSRTIYVRALEDIVRPR
jgi:hypothetical protein